MKLRCLSFSDQKLDSTLPTAKNLRHYATVKPKRQELLSEELLCCSQLCDFFTKMVKQIPRLEPVPGNKALLLARDCSHSPQPICVQLQCLQTLLSLTCSKLLEYLSSLLRKLPCIFQQGKSMQQHAESATASYASFSHPFPIEELKLIVPCHKVLPQPEVSQVFSFALEELRSLSFELYCVLPRQNHIS